MNDAYDLVEQGPQTYEQYIVPTVFEPLARLLLSKTDLTVGQSVLDVACGTGIVARLAKKIVGTSGKVTGVDFSAGMLEVARNRADAEGMPIEWHLADATSLPLQDSVIDIVFCQQGLQFFPDKLAAAAEMHRVLRAKGRLWLAVWQSVEFSPINLAIKEVVERHLGPDIAAATLGPFKFSDADELRLLMSGAGFQDIQIETATIMRHTPPAHISIPSQLNATPVGKEISGIDEDRRAIIVEEIGEALSDYVTNDGLSVPQGTHIATAQKF
jgi:ubiquinone/menaquinone biosynthesis C-methylase UbiE